MAIKHVNGFGLVAFDQVGLLYEVNGREAIGRVDPAGPSAPAGSLSADHSFWISGVIGVEQEYTTRGLPARDTWTLNIWYRNIFAHGNNDWFRFRDASGTVFSLKQRSDGKMELRNASNSVIYTTTHVFALSIWVAIQLRVEFGISGSWQLKLDGVVVASDSGVNLTTRQPDRMMLRWTQGGGGDINVAHWVMADETGPWNIGFLPYPWYTTPLYPIEDRATGWTPSDPTKTRAFLIADRLSGAYATYPDGELTYVTPGASNAVCLSRMLESPCYGRTLAIAANVCAKQLTPDQHLEVIVREDGIDRQIGSQLDLADWTVVIVPLSFLVDYRTYQAITEERDGAVWTDGDIDLGSWGFRAVTTDVHVTQFYLEKVVATLLPFDCGKLSNYGF